MELTKEPEAPIRTARSVKALQISREVWPFIKQDYASGHQHKAEGRPVAWSCALVEKELFYAMGVYPFFPEQFAALCAVRRRGGSRDESVEKESLRFARIAEAEGYPSYLCGYMRVCIGYVINNDLADAPLEGMPRPDFMVTSSSGCDVRLKWFEDMSQRLNVPLFVLDRPERKVRNTITLMPERYEVDYYTSQLEDCIAFMEQVTHSKYDPDRMHECLDWSYKLNEVAQECLELRKSVPTPMGCADEFTLMYPWMYKAGTREAYEFYVKIRSELEERVAQGVGVIPEERFRLMWVGLPTWFNMGVFNYMEKFGGVFVRSPEYRAFPYPPTTTEDPLRELATRFLFAGYGAYGMGSRVCEIIHDCKEYEIDAAILSYLITCRPHAFAQTEIRHILEEELEVPTVSVEGDLVDERLYSEAQVNTRLDALAEQILRKKAARL